MNNTLLRTISGSVYVILIIALILFSNYSLVLLFLFLLVFGIIEANRIMEALGGVYKYSTLLVSILIYGLFATSFLFPSLPLIILLPFLPVGLFVLYMLFLFKEDVNKDLSKIGNSLIAITYLSFPLSMALVIGQLSSPFVLLSVFIFLWSNDSFAYIVGRWLGKHKLFESISPKKTIEGFLGGFIGAIATAIIIFYFNQDLSLMFWMVLGGVVSVSGTIGDLFESLLKRKSGIKDSGNIMPGHGGILDRIDSLLFAIPFSYLFILLHKYFNL